MSNLRHPGPIGHGAAVFWLSAYNLGQFVLILGFSYLLAALRPDLAGNNAFLVVMGLIGFGGYILCRVTYWWVPSTVGYLGICFAIASFLAADLASGSDSSSYEVSFAIFVGVLLAVGIFVFKPDYLKGWVPHVISLLPIIPVAYVLVPAIFPLLGLKYVGANPLELLFGAFMNGGFVVLNLKTCYLKGNWTLNAIADSCADNVKGFFQWIFRGKVKISVTTVEDEPLIDKVFRELKELLLLAREIKGDQMGPLTDEQLRALAVETLAVAGPDRYEQRVRSLLMRILAPKANQT